MKFKNISIGLLTSVLLISSINISYAVDDKTTLVDYVNEVKSHNTDYTLLIERLPREITEYEKAAQLSKAIDQKTLDDSDDDYNLVVKRDINPLERKQVVLNLKYDIMKKEHETVQLATKYYYDYIIEQKDFLNSKESYETTLKEYELKKKEKELGIISEIALLKFEQEYYTSYISYLNNTNKFETLKKNINIERSKELSADINFDIIDITKVNTDYSVNVDKEKEAAFANSHQIKALELQNEISEKTLVTKTRNAGFNSIVVEMNNINDSIKENNLKINDIKSDLEYNLIRLSNELKIEKNKYAIAEMQYNLDLKDFNTMKIKYDNGLISLFDYTKSKQNLTSSEIIYNRTRVTMAIKVMEAKAYVEENTTLIK